MVEPQGCREYDTGLTEPADMIMEVDVEGSFEAEW